MVEGGASRVDASVRILKIKEPELQPRLAGAYDRAMQFYRTSSGSFYDNSLAMRCWVRALAPDREVTFESEDATRFYVWEGQE